MCSDFVIFAPQPMNNSDALAVCTLKYSYFRALGQMQYVEMSLQTAENDVVF